MMVNINTSNFPKGMSTLAMQSNGPLPQIIYHAMEWSQLWSKFMTKVVTAPLCSKYKSNSFRPKCDPLVFDVFYLRKYYHHFGNCIDIIIQIF